MDMTTQDSQFLQQFEQLTLPAEQFNHLGHIKIAWLYLQKFSTELACEKVCSGIKAYATSLGAATKFHFTITQALVMLIRIRMVKLQQDNSNWQTFVTNNQDLVNNAVAVLQQFYTPELLQSTQAKNTWCSPDIKELPCIP